MFKSVCLSSVHVSTVQSSSSMSRMAVPGATLTASASETPVCPPNAMVSPKRALPEALGRDLHADQADGRIGPRGGGRLRRRGLRAPDAGLALGVDGRHGAQQDATGDRGRKGDEDMGAHGRRKSFRKPDGAVRLRRVNGRAAPDEQRRTRLDHKRDDPGRSYTTASSVPGSRSGRPTTRNAPHSSRPSLQAASSRAGTNAALVRDRDVSCAACRGAAFRRFTCCRQSSSSSCSCGCWAW